MVSNLKVLQCIRKLWPGQENFTGHMHLQTPNSHCGDYVELNASGHDKNDLLVF